MKATSTRHLRKVTPSKVIMIMKDDLGIIMVDDVRLRIDTRPYILLDSKRVVGLRVNWKFHYVWSE
jgi:hypothetical protein